MITAPCRGWLRTLPDSIPRNRGTGHGLHFVQPAGPCWPEAPLIAGHFRDCEHLGAPSGHPSLGRCLAVALRPLPKEPGTNLRRRPLASPGISRLARLLRLAYGLALKVLPGIPAGAAQPVVARDLGLERRPTRSAEGVHSASIPPAYTLAGSFAVTASGSLRTPCMMNVGTRGSSSLSVRSKWLVRTRNSSSATFASSRANGAPRQK